MRLKDNIEIKYMCIELSIFISNLLTFYKIILDYVLIYSLFVETATHTERILSCFYKKLSFR